MLTLSQYIERLIEPNYPNAKVYNARVDFDLNEARSRVGMMQLQLHYTVIGYTSFDADLLTVGSMEVFNVETQRRLVPFTNVPEHETEVRCHMLQGKETEELVQHLANMFKASS